MGSGRLRLLLTGRLAEEVAERIGDRDDVEARVGQAGTESSLADWAQAHCGFAPEAALDYRRLQLVHGMGAGFDAWDAVRVGSSALWTRTIGDMPQRAAAYVLQHLLDAWQQASLTRSGEVRAEWIALPAAPLLADRRVLVLGTGSLGREIARLLAAVGVRVTGANTTGAADPDLQSVCSDGVVSLRDLCDRPRPVPDGVVCTLPGNAATHRIVGGSLLAQWHGATFINLGRGRVLDLDALRLGLERHEPARAVLDVFEVEPLPAASWLWSDPRVTVTPHIAAPTTAGDVACDLGRVLDARRHGLRPPSDLLVQDGHRAHP